VQDNDRIITEEQAAPESRNVGIDNSGRKTDFKMNNLNTEDLVQILSSIPSQNGSISIGGKNYFL
jgi:hypothetical protein